MTPLSRDIVRTAFHYCYIRDNPEASVSPISPVLTSGPKAFELVSNDMMSFEAIIWDEIARYPNFRRYFSHLVAARVRQENALSSPLLSSIFNGISKVERRLAQVQIVAGIDILRTEYQPAKDPDKGNRTDEAALDCLAEILILFFLVNMRFEDIARVASAPNTPHIDVKARRRSREYAIEITRKKENPGWSTLAFGNLTDCSSAVNREKMRNVIYWILVSKCDQFSRCLEAGSIAAEATRVVAIKLSDFGFQDCIEEAGSISRSLLADELFDTIDIIWLVPDIEADDSCWIHRARD